MSRALPIRRVVTGHDASGRSIIVSDGSAPAVHEAPHTQGLALTDIWVASQVPVSNSGASETTKLPLSLQPPNGGLAFRILELPPDSQRVFGETSEYFSRMGAEKNLHGEGQARHPAMHRTRTLDLIVILAGEVWALMDEGEVLLKAGDCLVQRGTSHAWSNRSDRPCLIAGVLVDAQDLANS